MGLCSFSKKIMGRRKIPKAKPEYNSEGERVYCLDTCRKPDDGNFMIGCDGCDEWFSYFNDRFHGECVGKEAPEEDDEDEDWNCSKCEKLLAELDDGKPSSPVKKFKVTDLRVKTEKIRRMARKAFEETFTTLFENISKEGLTEEIDFNDPAGVAEKVENFLFQAYSTNDEPSAAYKAKYRSLQVCSGLISVQLKGPLKRKAEEKDLLCWRRPCYS